MIMIGQGGHAGSVKASLWRAFKDSSMDLILVKEDLLLEEWSGKKAFIAIGENSARERISKMNFDFNFSIFDPTSLGGLNTSSKGSFFGHNSFVGANSSVGNFCIVNTGAILEHDCELGDYSHLASGAVTGGNVKIGKRTLIGTGAVIRNGITIGDDVVVGAGAVVVDNIPDGQVWFGVPARHQWGNQK